MNYPTSKQLKTICSNSVVQEIDLPNYEIELDFTDNCQELNAFTANHESELQLNEVITFIFDNKVLPQANMLSISPGKSSIKYELSITFWYRNWQESKPIHSFILSLINYCNRHAIDLALEAEDKNGYYLLLSVTDNLSMTIEERIKKLNEVLINAINKVK